MCEQRVKYMTDQAIAKCNERPQGMEGSGEPKSMYSCENETLDDVSNDDIELMMECRDSPPPPPLQKMEVENLKELNGMDLDQMQAPMLIKQDEDSPASQPASPLQPLHASNFNIQSIHCTPMDSPSSSEGGDSLLSQFQTTAMTKNNEMQEISNTPQQSFALKESNHDNSCFTLSTFPTRSITVLSQDLLPTDKNEETLQESLVTVNTSSACVTASGENQLSSLPSAAVGISVDSNQSTLRNHGSDASIQEPGDTENGNGRYSPVPATPSSIYSIQSSITIIPGGKSKLIPEAHMKIRTKTRQYFQADIEMLKNRLREEGFIMHSIRWLHQKRYLPPHKLCFKCGLCSFELKEQITVKGEYFWQCQTPRCLAYQVVNRPGFFQRFPSIPLEVLLLLTYHWAVLTRLEDILEELPLEVDIIWYYFQVLQELCMCVMKKPSCRLGTLNDHNVGACAVELGRYVVLGAHAKQSGCVRLHALTPKEAYHSAMHADLLCAWVWGNSNLFTEKNVNLLKTMVCEASPQDVLPTKTYLTEKLTQMFGWVDLEEINYCSLSRHLAELQWRERFGKFPEMAFWNIMNQIERDAMKIVPTIVKPKDMVCHLGKDIHELRLGWGHLEKVFPKRALPLKRKYDQDMANEMVTETVSDPYAHATELMYVQRKENLKNLSPSVLPLIQEKSAPLLSGGIAEVTAENLLRIKMIFDVRRSDSSFDAKLLEEGILIHPIPWLLRNGFIQQSVFCNKCWTKSILVRSLNFKDDYAWFCKKCCRHVCGFQRSPFFARFGFSFTPIMMLIMQWAQQGNVNTFHSMLKLDIYQICYVWRSIQEACLVAGQRDRNLLGGADSIVEVCVFEYGPYFILTAHDRKTKLSRLKAFTINASLQPKMFVQALESWVHPKTTIVVNSRIFEGFGTVIIVQQSDPSITNKSDPGFHILNVLGYMVKHLLNIFGGFQFQRFTPKLVEMYLEEFMWRERYGRTSKDAFWNIMSEIASTELQVVASAAVGHVAAVKLKYKGKTYRCFICGADKDLCYLPSLGPANLLKWLSSIKQFSLVSKYPNLNTILHTEAVCQQHYANFVNYVCANKKVVIVTSDPKGLESMEEDYTLSAQAMHSLPSSSHPEELNGMQINVGLQTFSPQIVNTYSIVPTGDSKSVVTKQHVVVIKKEPEDVPCSSSSEDLISCSSITEAPAADPTYEKLVLNLPDIGHLECVECSGRINPLHFKKCYQCTCCKNYSYLTYCSRAFSQHKRMPNEKSKCYRIGKPLALENPYFCPCGYNNVHGNDLASHLVKCGQSTCYSYIDV